MRQILQMNNDYWGIGKKVPWHNFWHPKMHTVEVNGRLMITENCSILWDNRFLKKYITFSKEWLEDFGGSSYKEVFDYPKGYYVKRFKPKELR